MFGFLIFLLVQGIMTAAFMPLYSISVPVRMLGSVNLVLLGSVCLYVHGLLHNSLVSSAGFKGKRGLIAES